VLGATPSFAQAQAASQPNSQSGGSLRVFLLTFGPGSDPWEKFGHDAILIQDTDTGNMVAYNWGVFDFGEGVSGFTAFAWHFIQGRLWYEMESEPADAMLGSYEHADRSILGQELNLTPAQKLDLQARLIANDTDANRHYLYDYFKKNCSTMARDAIDKTVDGRVHAALENIPTSTTYRWHDRRTTADTVWLYLFLDLALGQPVDRPLSAWQECFLPGKLAEHLKSVQVPDANGKLIPLIGASQQLKVGSFPERTEPPAWYGYCFFAASLCIGIALGSLGWVGRRKKLARWAFNFIGVLWSFVAGGFGVLLTYLWFSNHDAAKWNENWFQFNPLSLLLIVLLPAAWYWPRAAKAVAFSVLGLCVLGVLAKLTPWFWQLNWQIIAITLPIHAGIGCGIFPLGRGRPGPLIMDPSLAKS
jgi:hypothetical protein